MSASEVVRRYASTLLDAADEAGPGSEAVRSDMEGLTATLAASGELREFLSNRLVDAQLVELLDGNALAWLGPVAVLLTSFQTSQRRYPSGSSDTA